MKIHKYITILAAVALSVTACADWLDVAPRTEIDADKLYEHESGFKQVLTGVYASMCKDTLYGREMTFGMVDILGGVYPDVGSGYEPVQAYNYEYGQVENLIGGVWRNSYNAIANLNHMISYLREADRSIFQPDNYNVILGEALGLRAMLHFDLLRLYSPSFKADPDALAIPYVTDYKFIATPHESVSVVIGKILGELTEAAALLRESDPMVTGREIGSLEDEGYLLHRDFRLNYYAVRAVMARVHMWRGEQGEAAACASEVIGSGLFNWVAFDEATNQNDEQRDRTYSPEHIFALQSKKLADSYAGRLQRSNFNLTGQYSLLFNQAYRNSLFNIESDYRLRFLWRLEASEGQPFSNMKLWQYETMPDDYKYRLPLIRLPEMYLILAETKLESDPDGAASLISELMLKRGIAAGIAPGATPEVLRTAITTEYRREFISEGVMFHYFKRLDSDRIDGGAAAFTKDKYVLPMPLNETEFGNIPQTTQR